MPSPDLRLASQYSLTLAHSLQHWLSGHIADLSQAEAAMLVDSYTHLALLAGGMNGYLARQEQAMTQLGQLEKLALTSDDIAPAQVCALVDDIRRQLVVPT
jgi:hypothetical protein